MALKHGNRGDAAKIGAPWLRPQEGEALVLRVKEQKELLDELVEAGHDKAAKMLRVRIHNGEGLIVPLEGDDRVRGGKLPSGAVAVVRDRYGLLSIASDGAVSRVSAANLAEVKGSPPAAPKKKKAASKKASSSKGSSPSKADDQDGAPSDPFEG